MGNCRTGSPVSTRIALTTAGAMALTYDARGLLSERGDTTFTWDFAGRMTGALRNGTHEKAPWAQAKLPASWGTSIR